MVEERLVILGERRGNVSPSEAEFRVGDDYRGLYAVPAIMSHVAPQLSTWNASPLDSGADSELVNGVTDAGATLFQLVDHFLAFPRAHITGMCKYMPILVDRAR